MTSVTIIPVTAVSVTHADGGATSGSPLTGSLWGNAFSWENPHNLNLTFGAATTALQFNDANGILADNPVSGSSVIDQQLTAPVTIAGQTFTPNANTTLWQTPAPVFVEDEYHVTLFDDAGHQYTMVGVSVTSGYTSQVVGVSFLGDAPPPGTVLHYIQNRSTFTGDGQSAPIANLHTPAAPVCFLRGTRIATATGPRRVEDLAAGDLIETLDHGLQPIRWVGSSRVSGMGPLAPIRIAAGRLGNDRDLMVSPNHRLLLSGPAVELNFGEAEVLVAAKHLVDGTSIRALPQPTVEYFHILLDRHELLIAEGAAAESLYLGPVTLRSLDAAARAEIAEIFPDAPWRNAPLSRPVVSCAESPLLRAA